MNSFSTSKSSVLFGAIFLLIFYVNLIIKISLFFMKLAKLYLLAKLACANLTVKFSAVNLLNSGVVIYLFWSGIVYSIPVRAVVVVKLVIFDILFLTLFIPELKAAVVDKLVIPQSRTKY